MSKKRRYFSGSDKVRILRIHLLEHKPVSEICNDFDLHPTQFYNWMNEFFTNGHLAFDTKKRRGPSPEEKQIEALKHKLADREEGIAELMSEHVALKKKLGVS